MFAALSDPIHTLADLDTWSFPGTALAVLGHPISHSVSPPMHNAALAEMARQDARFASWKYFRFDIKPEDLPVALDKFKTVKFRGLNLTIPHKVLAFDLVDSSLSNAAEIGAVNTLSLTDLGWDGDNTDGYGLKTGMLEDLGLSIEGRDIILLGAGGAARGAAVTCVLNKCRSLWIGNRNAKNLSDLMDEFQRGFLMSGVLLKGFDLSQPHLVSLPENALVINATSAGLKPSDALPLDLAAIARPCAVYDMIYNPSETPLLAQARALGIPAANGLGMLVHQGARALNIWSGATVPVDAMRAAVHSALKAHA
jgi:shikimate dehydrogenase